MKINYGNSFTIKPRTKTNIVTFAMGVLFMVLMIWQYTWTNANIKHRDNVQREVHSFIKACFSERKLDKEKFNELCKVAKENNYEVRIGYNSENLTIDQSNIKDNMPLFGRDRIVIGGIGSGGFIVERLDFDNLNRKPQIHRDKFGHTYID
jgi:hypothetical protein